MNSDTRKLHRAENNLTFTAFRETSHESLGWFISRVVVKAETHLKACLFVKAAPQPPPQAQDGDTQLPSQTPPGPRAELDSVLVLAATFRKLMDLSKPDVGLLATSQEPRLIRVKEFCK